MKRVLVAIAVALLFAGVAAGAAVNVSTDDYDTPDGGNVSEADAGEKLRLGISQSEQRVVAGYETTRFNESARAENATVAVERRELGIVTELSAIDVGLRTNTKEYVDGEIDEEQYVRELVAKHQQTEILRDDAADLRERTPSGYEFDRGFKRYGGDRSLVLTSVSGADAEALEAVYLGEREGNITVREGVVGVEVIVETQNTTYRQVNTAVGFGSDQAGQSQIDAVEAAREVTGEDWVVSGVTTDEVANAHLVTFDSTDSEGRAVTAVTKGSGAVMAHTEVVRHNESAANATAPIAVAMEGNGERVRLAVFHSGERLPGAEVFVRGERVGATDENGTVVVSLPENETAEVRVDAEDSTVVRQVTRVDECSGGTNDDEGDSIKDVWNVATDGISDDAC